MSAREKPLPRKGPARALNRDRGRPSTPFLRERILSSAMHLFAQTEFDRVTIDEVAERAGVGKGSVYRQFGSKEELYAGAVVNGFIELQQEIRASLKDRVTFADRLETIIGLTIKYFWTRRQFFEFLRDPRAVPPRQERLYRAERANLALMIREVIESAATKGVIRRELDSRLAAEALLGMVRGINRYAREYTSPAAATRTVVSIFLNGCVRDANASDSAARAVREGRA
jgi:AcrR family transcriptional regulator